MIQQAGATMPLVTIFGPPGSALSYAIRDFLYRSDVPFEWVQLVTDAQAHSEAGVENLANTRLPICVFADGTRLERPTIRRITQQLGWFHTPLRAEYDLAIYGAGPAGFRLYWRWKSRRRPPGRPPIDLEIRTLIRRMARENPTLYSIRPESQVRREDPFLPRKERAEGRGGEAAKHGGPALADQRTETPGTLGGSAPDCPGRQENGAEGSRESCPPEGRYKGNLPFLFRGRACEVRRRRISALRPRSRLGGSDACSLRRR